MISFNSVPNNIRVPLFYAEFDNSLALQGLTQQPYKLLVFGQMASGTASANVPVQVTSLAQAKSLFGHGSMLSRMFDKLFQNNTSIETWAMPLSDSGSGVAATGTITVSGPATASGTLALYIHGVEVSVGVSSGDSASTIASNIVAAINALVDLGVTASASSAVVTVTAKNKGLNGNKIDIRTNYQPDDLLPAGVGAAIVGMASGATNPTLATAIAAMGLSQWNVVVFPYIDSGSLTAIEAELLTRWGPTYQNDGMAFTASDDTVGNLTTLGTGQNSKHVCIVGTKKFPNTPEEVAAAVAGQVAGSASIDPARPFQTLQLMGILAPAMVDQLLWSERNTLLYDGISSLSVAAGGVIQIERLITTYQTNAFGSPDISYLNVETILTLSYLRFSYKALITSRYPRHKLAADGILVGPGQAIVTPKVLKAETIAIFRQWEENGLVQGVDQFKNDLVIELNDQDPDRVDARLSPQLVNQFRVLGVQYQFLL